MGGATRVGVSLGPYFQRGEVSTPLPSVRKMLRHLMNANKYRRIPLSRIKAVLQSFSHWGAIMGTQSKINELSNDFKVYWRKRWDSNPRYGSPYASFQD